MAGGLNPRRKLPCPVCRRRVGVSVQNGKTRLARHRPTEGKVPGELPGHYQRCNGSGTVVASL